MSSLSAPRDVRERSERVGGRSNRIGVHFALILSSFLFALPFLWLLLTSFKEEGDITSNGIVWVPKVQDTKMREGRKVPLVSGNYDGRPFTGIVLEAKKDGSKRVQIEQPHELRGTTFVAPVEQLQPVKRVGIHWENYSAALNALPPESGHGLTFLSNTLIVVTMCVIGTVLSSALVAFAFARMRFPGRGLLFIVMLSTMMLPPAVTLLPTFLIFRSLGWVDTLLPLWVPAFLGSAFNVFLLRQFFLTVPVEFEDAAKIDGCGPLQTFWFVMVPQIKHALITVAVWTFIGAWGNFVGPLIYINSPEKMTLSYALQLFSGDKVGEPGVLMAFAVMVLLPVLLVYVAAQRYFVEGIRPFGRGEIGGQS